MDYQAIALIEAYKKLIQLKDEKIALYERKLENIKKERENGERYERRLTSPRLPMRD